MNPTFTHSQDNGASSGAGHNLFSMRLSERKLLLGLIDLCLLNGTLLLALAWRWHYALSLSTVWEKPSWFLLLSTLWLGCAFITDSYSLARAAQPAPALIGITQSILLTWIIFVLVPYVSPDLPDSRLDLVAFPLLSLCLIGGWRLFYIAVFVQPCFEHRALVVGAGWAGSTLVRALREMERPGAVSSPHMGYKIVGFIDDDAAKSGETIEGIPVVGACLDMVALTKKMRVQELVVAITHLETIHPGLFDAIQECRERGITITPMTELYEQIVGRVPIEHAGRVFSVAVPLCPPPTHRFYLGLQRLVDIIVSIGGCLLLAFFIPFVWIANRLGSPGPLFYSQERVGKAGHTFKILKFRSMVTDAEGASGVVWASENDPRITRVGNLLRKTRLDEIPQFWNILRGDMSLIGPRPERPHFVEILTRQIPFYRVRHAVRPGLTGWAQVRYRYGASEEDSLVKLQYDLYYIKHQRLLLDAEILLKTLPVVLGFKGR